MKKFEAPLQWESEVFCQPAFKHIDSLLGLSHLSEWPSFSWLNSHTTQELNGQKLTFTPNAELEGETRYYEQIIYETAKVPTREQNWHDLFGAIIWCLFPKTKALLNKLHIEEIEQYGLQQRSKKRNALTLFDECGLILTIPSGDWQDNFKSHLWTDVFVKQREAWGSSVEPFVFGHANYEMLTRPFEGLTGKLLCIVVDEGFYDMTLVAQYAWLDDTLYKMISEHGFLNDNSKMSPIPLLGIPRWTEDNLDPNYYNNTSYFRPKRRKTS